MSAEMLAMSGYLSDQTRRERNQEPRGVAPVPAGCNSLPVAKRRPILLTYPQFFLEEEAERPGINVADLIPQFRQATTA